MLIDVINRMDASAREVLKLGGKITELNALKKQLGYKPVALPAGPRLTVRVRNKWRFNPAEHSDMYVNGPRLAAVRFPVNRVKFMDAK